MDSDSATNMGIAIAVLLFICVYALPTIVAFQRQHEYRWIIFAINVALGGTGLGWLVAMVWAIYPGNKSLADPLLGNPTGLGARNVGHTLGEVGAHINPQRDQQLGASSALDSLDRLAALAEKGIITPDEFEKKKANLLCHI